MTTKLTLALLAAALLGGCAIVPIGYDDGGYRGYYRDRHYRGDRYDRDDYYRRDRWQGQSWRDYDRDRFYSSGGYYLNREHGQ
jgi:hypothetical protein